MDTPYFNEDFLEFESKVDELTKLLEDIRDANKLEGTEAKKSIEEKPNINDFIITVKDNRTVINKKPADKMDDAEMDKFTFMKQIEQDAEERFKNKKERERIAQNFRNYGNDAYRKELFEKAVIMYTKAIEYINDSPILYNNRALAYMKLKNNQRAIIDCDYVLNKLDQKNLRSWLYRAIAFKRCGNEKNFEESIKWARKTHPKQLKDIKEFLDKFAREPI